MSDETDNVKKVLAALSDQRYRWRTVPGVARDAGVPAEEVVQIIAAQPDTVLRSRTPSITGEALFTTRQHLLDTASVGEKVMGAFKNRLY